MKKNLFFVMGALILVIGVFYFAKKFYLAQKNTIEVTKSVELSENDSKKLADTISLLNSAYSPSIGPSDAPVTIVEFLDPECEACRAMYPEIKNIMKEYNGKIRLVVRYMPFHQNSMLAANSLEAARDQGKYWEALELLFKTQPEWGDHANPQPEKIEQFMNRLSLDMNSFRKTVREKKHSWKVEKDLEVGEKLGVRVTPTFFINGKIVESLDYMFFKTAIEENLAIQKK